jgi:hypothetical protein
MDGVCEYDLMPCRRDRMDAGSIVIP